MYRKLVRTSLRYIVNWSCIILRNHAYFLNMKRIYETLLLQHINENRQMALLTGPRQVGKTTSARAVDSGHRYFSWDIPTDRRRILKGPDAVAEGAGVQELRAAPPVIVIDELHKYGRWKSFLKGMFDAYADRCRLIVTGSARLDIFKRGGDSLMGRYFVYRMHPLSVSELIRSDLPESEIRPPARPDPQSIPALLQFGGFPEPFVRGTTRFHNRWAGLRTEQLFREDIRDTTRVQEADRIRVLAEILAAQAGQLINYSSLASDVGASVDTVRRWLVVLESFFYCFTIRPWFRNVAKSLRKQPKVYLRDWSLVGEPGARHENFVACHLLKAVTGWTDMGLGKYQLCYLRDKAGREVDFVVVKNGEPWFLVEAKSSGHREISPALAYYQGQAGAAHAFQVALDADYVEQDCFSVRAPVIVPAATLLSQLL